MPDFLLELFSEEIPARMQTRAAEDLRRLVTDRLVGCGLTYEAATAFATPRRLTLSVKGLPARQPDGREERRGPRVGAPASAIAGFLKSAGLANLDQARIQSDPKRGDFYVAVIEKPGRPAIDVIAEIVPEVVREFPWPKSMRWGAQSQKAGSLSWVRPLHAIVATFGPETEEPEVVRFSVDGITAGDITYGHRFLAPAPIRVRRFEDYVKKLEAAKVVLDPARRQEIILHDARNLAFAQGYELVEDPALAAEVVGLVEWPVVLMGSFDEAFLTLPPEVIRATIRNNQKCFVLRPAAHRPSESRARSADAAAPTPPRPLPAADRITLAPKFILVANTEPADGGAAIIAGNERVIRARLADAKFFYETDLKRPLAARLERLKDSIFHEKLGTQYERVERIERLARTLAPIIGADPDKAARAARLAKADLATEMVGEFPELQGVMGRYYALVQGEDPNVAQAIEEHYKPLGPSDRVPSEPVSVAVALADKIDTLVGFWAIDEKPTGSKDPYALRRAALGIIRLILDNGIRLKLGAAIANSVMLLPRGDDARPIDAKILESTLLSFLADRLKVQLRDQGARHDLVDAVFALEGRDDLVLIVRRIEALARFLDTEDGRNLLAGYRRAVGIIEIEERKDGRSYRGSPDPRLYLQKEERELAAAIHVAKQEAEAAVAREDFEAAMRAVAALRPAVDAFFDRVTVNVPAADRRENRLRLLNEIREATRTVADFSRIEGPQK